MTGHLLRVWPRGGVTVHFLDEAWGGRALSRVTQPGVGRGGVSSLWDCGQPGSTLGLGHKNVPVARGVLQGEAAQRCTLCTASFTEGLVLLTRGFPLAPASREHLAQESLLGFRDKDGCSPPLLGGQPRPRGSLRQKAGAQHGLGQCAPPLHPRPPGIRDNRGSGDLRPGLGEERWREGVGRCSPPPPLPAALSHRFPSCSEVLF